MTSGAGDIGRGLSEHERQRVARIEQFAAVGAIPSLIDMLADPSWAVRRHVVAALARLGDVAVAPLCDVLVDARGDETRLAAAVDALSASTGAVEPRLARLVAFAEAAVLADVAQILGRRGAPSAVSVLTDLVAHPDDNVAVTAVEALGRVGGRAAVEALIAAVTSGQFFRVFPAIDVLGRSGDPRAVAPLADLLHEPVYALEAARALGRTAQRSAVAPLTAALAGSVDALVRVAAVALCLLGERYRERTATDDPLADLVQRAAPGAARRRLRHCLAGADVTEAAAICRLLGLLDDEEAMPLLVQCLDGPTPVARAAAEALRRISREPDAAIAGALRSGDSARRKALLPLLDCRCAGDGLLECLLDPDPEVRATTCEVLARTGDRRAVAPLFERLADDNLRVVHAAATAIQAIGGVEARQLAVRATTTGPPAVRRSALRILAFFRNAADLPIFLSALEEPDLRIRELAVQGLAFFDDCRAQEALFATARGPVDRHRAVAMRVLGQCQDGPRVQAALLRGLADPDPWVRYYACQSLGRLGCETAAARLSELVFDGAGQVRVAAVEALSHLSSPAAHQALRSVAHSDEEDIRRAALIGLGIAGRAEDLPVLLAATSCGDLATRLVALSALSAFDAPCVLAALAAAAFDAAEPVSAAAINVLGGRAEHEAAEILVSLLTRPATRERALEALTVPAAGRIPGVLASLATASDELAPLLTSALARMRSAEALEALFETMQLANPAARRAAAYTLAAQGSTRAVHILRETATSDSDDSVRQISALLISP